MSTWFRIQDGVAVESTDVDPVGRYNPDLVWALGTPGAKIGDHYDGTTFTAPSSSAAPAPTLADRRAALAIERYAKQSGGVMFQSAAASAPSLVASDPVSTGMLTASYVAATSGHWVDGTPWKMADGSFVPLTSADMQVMALKVLGYISACFAREAQLSATLGADLTTDITQGWPANS